jgi:uncharacterized membrane protein YphA (DoxX/SURF4 family)
MDETEHDPAKPGPALTEVVHEVQGRFPNDAALQDALGRLTLAGFDHADFSLPDPSAETKTPDQGADAATDEIDKAQVRTMASGIASASAASLVAGVMIATGGAAAPVAAAAAATALGTAAATSGAGVAADQANASERDRLGAEGKLILAVRTATAEKVQQAIEAMRQAGAQDVTSITRADEALTRGVSAASWTGG